MVCGLIEDTLFDEDIHVFTTPIIPAQLPPAPYFCQLAPSGKSISRPAAVCFFVRIKVIVEVDPIDVVTRPTSIETKRIILDFLLPGSSQSWLPSGEPMRMLAADMIGGTGDFDEDARPIRIEHACSSRPRLCASSTANANGSYIRLRAFAHRSRQNSGPWLQSEHTKHRKPANLKNDAFHLSCAAQSRIASNSAFCSAVVNPLLEGSQCGDRRNPGGAKFAHQFGRSDVGRSYVAARRVKGIKTQNIIPQTSSGDFRIRLVCAMKPFAMVLQAFDSPPQLRTAAPQKLHPASTHGKSCLCVTKENSGLFLEEILDDLFIFFRLETASAVNNLAPVSTGERLVSSNRAVPRAAWQSPPV